jgi:hypothetical protein
MKDIGQGISTRSELEVWVCVGRVLCSKGEDVSIERTDFVGDVGRPVAKSHKDGRWERLFERAMGDLSVLQVQDGPCQFRQLQGTATGGLSFASNNHFMLSQP